MAHSRRNLNKILLNTYGVSKFYEGAFKRLFRIKKKSKGYDRSSKCVHLWWPWVDHSRVHHITTPPWAGPAPLHGRLPAVTWWTVNSPVTITMEILLTICSWEDQPTQNTVRSFLCAFWWATCNEVYALYNILKKQLYYIYIYI